MAKAKQNPFDRLAKRLRDLLDEIDRAFSPPPTPVRVPVPVRAPRRPMPGDPYR